MYRDEYDAGEGKLKQERLHKLTQTEAWKQYVKPFLLHRLRTSKYGIFYADDNVPLHWQCIGVHAHIHDFLNFVEGDLWPKEKESLVPNPRPRKEGLLKRIKNALFGENLSRESQS